MIAAAVAVWVAVAGYGLPALAFALGAGLLAFRASRDLKVSRRNRVGADSEAEVRRALRPLVREDWSVRHSVSVRTGGDLDHVLRAPSGVGFVIETKTARYTPAHAARTIHAARRLERRHRRYPGGVTPVLATRAGGAEAGDLSVFEGPQRRDLAGRAGHRTGLEIDLEVVLGEVASRRGGRLDLVADLDVGLLKPLDQGAGAVA